MLHIPQTNKCHVRIQRKLVIRVYLPKKQKFERMIKSGGTNYITTLNSSIFRDILKEFLSNKIMLQKTDEMSEPSTKIAKCDSVSE